MTVIAVMQPTFIPWVGYFALIESVDKFVLLDDVQFSKQSWQSRNKIKTSNGALTLSLGVSREVSKPLIKEAKLASNGFEKKLLKSIQGSLSRAPYYNVVDEIMNHAFLNADGMLCRLNTSIIKEICRLVGIETAFVNSSELSVPDLERTSRLLAISNSLSADIYISPVGSFDYLEDDNPFTGTGVSLRFMNYEHPEYEQLFPPFLSHMSAIDMLANVGPDRFKDVVMSGFKVPLQIQELRNILNDKI